MTLYFDRKGERQRKQRDTPERILEIARRKGRFEASLRYHDGWLRARCKALKLEGLLRGGHRDGDNLVYYPSREEDQCATAS
jgi:hypothetical protein